MNIIHHGCNETLQSLPLHIIWIPTYHCNYQCSYCAQLNCRPKGKDWLDESETLRIFDNLMALDRSWYILTITGGEPTIYPHLQGAIDYIGKAFGDKLKYLHISSNGSHKPELYETLAAMSKTLPINLAVSIHTEHAGGDQLEHLIKLMANSASLTFNLMFNPALRRETADFLEQLLSLREEFPFWVNIQTIRQMGKDDIIDPRYTPEDFKWQKNVARKFYYLNKYAAKPFNSGYPLKYFIQNSYIDGNGYQYGRMRNRDEAMKAGGLNFRGKFCCAGTHVLSIQPDGRAANAICAQASRSQKPLYEQNPYLDNNFCKIIECRQTLCGCAANDFLHKFASRQEAHDFLEIFNISRERRESSFLEMREDREKLAGQTRMLAKIRPENFPLNDYIDEAYYAASYPDVAHCGISAAEHYQTVGWREGRNPNSWFDTTYYLSQLPDPRNLQMNPLTHYILFGCAQGKRAMPD